MKKTEYRLDEQIRQAFLSLETKCLKSTSRQAPEKTGGKRSTFVKSVRSPVTNISAHLPASISIQHFKKALLYYFTINNPGIQDYYFTQADLEAIYRLKEQKYATASWNFNTYTL